MKSLEIYVPIDRRQALATGRELPERTNGTALFADISGFTTLTDTLVQELSPRHAVEELTRQLNRVYNALVGEVHRYGGSVIGFVGDAITCWFDRDHGLRAAACGLAMQQAIVPFAAIPLPTAGTVSLAIKVGLATGPTRRFRVGDPQIQYMDALTGVTLRWMALAEKQAQKGELLLDQETVAHLGDKVKLVEWRTHQETGRRFGVVSGLTEPVDPRPWPDLSPQALDQALVKPWLLPPVYNQLKTGQSRFLAELRPAVALFLKFDGLDYDHDEAAGQKLDAYLRWVQQTVTGYEGYVIQLTIGDKGSGS
jgi:class 3 adenylate cyclase